jgi:hypothetical protein
LIEGLKLELRFPTPAYSDRIDYGSHAGNSRHIHDSPYTSALDQQFPLRVQRCATATPPGLSERAAVDAGK